MRGSARRAPARGLRLPRGARAPPARRRPAGGLRGDAGRAASAARAAASPRCRSSSWSSTRSSASCQRGFHVAARQRAALASGAGDAVPLSHVLRHDALADDGRECGVDVGRRARAGACDWAKPWARSAWSCARSRACGWADRIRGGRKAALLARASPRGRSTRFACTSRARPASPTRSTNCCSTVARASSLRDPDQPSRAPCLAGASITPVGFELDETLLPYPRATFAGYALLQELFAFPQKFLFVDVSGVADALRTLGAGTAGGAVLRHRAVRAAERRQILELGINARTFSTRLHAGGQPLRAGAEPILLTQRTTEYAVVPDVRRRLEIEPWSIDAVAGITPGEGEPRSIEPLWFPPRPRRRRGHLLACRATGQWVAHRPGHRGSPSRLPICRVRSARPMPKWCRYR